MEDRLLQLAFKLHHEGGQEHMYGGFIFDPCFIFDYQCPCEMKARRLLQYSDERESKKDSLENQNFNNLFEPREV